MSFPNCPLLMVNPSRYPFFAVHEPTNFQNEKYSPGRMITFDTLGAAMLKFTALFSCSCASTFPSFRRIKDLWLYTRTGKISLLFLTANFLKQNELEIWRITRHFSKDILYVNGDISQKSFRFFFHAFILLLINRTIYCNHKCLWLKIDAKFGCSLKPGQTKGISFHIISLSRSKYNHKWRMGT